MNTTMTVAYAKLPAEVMNNITLIGGWFVFVNCHSWFLFAMLVSQLYRIGRELLL